ncbi:terminase small subunit [Vibrio phage vB_VpM-pA2SJ1]|uniref:Terminase small subunit n=1 Tax=Vibrio phage vB_VpM-pA2SJ1 TaxID=3095964 RepID=A0AAX4J5T5_9CAUD
MDGAKLTEEQKALYEALNVRQQKFALGILENKTERQAYIDAGYKPKTDNAADVAANKLIRNVKVAAFIDSVRKPAAEKAAESAIASREEVLRFLTCAIRTKVTDIAEFDERTLGEDPETGEEIKQSYWKLKGSKDLTPQAATVIEEVSSGKFGLKFKMVSKQQAAKQLADMMGWNAPTKTEHSGTIGTVQYTPEDYAKAQKAIESKFDELD